MIRLRYIPATILSIVIAVASAALPVYGAEASGFAVSPILPENQSPDTQGYFDLLMKPGQNQQLEIVVTNKEEKEIVVKVDTVTASTNSNGLVNYTSEGLMDETLLYSFSDIAAVDSGMVTIPPLESRSVYATITMPDKSFDGVILGSIQFLKELSEEERSSDAMILNQYSYVVGVRLRVNDNTPAPDFDLGEIGAELTNYKAAITAQIRNIEPLLVKDMDASVRIMTKDNREVAFERSKAGINMAPNSVMPFLLEDEAGYGVQAGTYIAAVHLEYAGEQWDFEREFTIKAEQATQINQSALNQQTQQTALSRGGLSTWAVGIIALLLAALIVVAVIMMKRNKGAEHD